MISKSRIYCEVEGSIVREIRIGISVLLMVRVV